jgi:hypothetical protein
MDSLIVSLEARRNLGGKKAAVSDRGSRASYAAHFYMGERHSPLMLSHGRVDQADRARRSAAGHSEAITEGCECEGHGGDRRSPSPAVRAKLDERGVTPCDRRIGDASSTYLKGIRYLNRSLHD